MLQGTFWAFAAVMNLCGFILMGRDKRLAKQHRRRIPEKTLFAAAALFGSAGSLLGMYAFRHKTKHRAFLLGMPALLVVQIAAVIAAYMYLPQVAALFAG